jgi:pentatricopeptide repeat protein
VSWRFRLLGDLEVRRDGERLSLTASKLRVLLVSLLLNDNRVVPFDRLEEVLWPEQPPVSARNAIHTYVMRLRRALGDQVTIHTRSTGYAIEIDPGLIDVNEFQVLLSKARVAAQADDLDAERAALTAALALWRGPVLSDVAPESLPDGVVRSLEEQRLHAVERRAAIDVQAERYHQAVADLLTLTRRHPLREQAWETLLLALSRAGRTAEALDAYREMRQVFQDELGIEPNEKIQLLYQSILATDRTLVDVQVETSEAVSPRILPGQLPMAPKGFAGREPETGLLIRHLSTEAAPVVVVSGAPGVGKSALTLRLAHHVRADYPDGQLYVNLQGYSLDAPLAPHVVLARFLRALGVPLKQIPTDQDDQSSMFRSLLADRRLLVVLDNAVGSDQVRPLLPGVAGCGVLVTSRDDLRGLAVDGARHVRLGPLDENASYAVLADILGTDRISAEPGPVTELIYSCAGLPLALRIAGANLAANPHLRIADYIAELRSLGTLEQLRVPGDEHAAVRTAFDLSYLRLPAAVARPFRLLGVVPGPDFSAAAVAALMDADAAAASRALDSLAAVNLIVASGPGRYQFHDLIREYAAAKTKDYVDVWAATERLWNYYLIAARGATDMLHRGMSRLDPRVDPKGYGEFASEAAALDWLDAERPNLVAAVFAAEDLGVAEHAGWITDALRGYFWMRANAPEALAVAEVARTVAHDLGDTSAEASAIDLMGLVYFRISRFELARRYHQQALELSREHGDVAGQSDSLHHIGRAVGQTEPPVAARRYFTESLTLAEQIDNLDARARNANYIGASYQCSGDFTEACTWLLRAMQLARRANNYSIANRALGALGVVEWALGNLSGAVSLHQENIELAERLGNLPFQAVSRIALAETRCDTGEFDRAIADAERGLALSVELGERRHQVSGLEVVATARFRSGQTAGIERTYRKALRLAREISFSYGEISTLIALAAVRRAAGDPAQSIELVSQALERGRKSGHLDLEAHALVQLGHAHLEHGDEELAADVAHKALTVTCERGTRLSEARALYLISRLPGSPAQAAEAALESRKLLEEIGAPDADIVPEAARRALGAQPSRRLVEGLA